MVKYRESQISAHHNYLINDMLAPGFVVGTPNSPKEFYFLADVVLPGESTPRISCRLFNEDGRMLFELNWNRIGKNPVECQYRSTPGGFLIMHSGLGPILEVSTKNFANGYLTQIKAKIFDEQGVLRMEPLKESIRICRADEWVLTSPYVVSKEKPDA